MVAATRLVLAVVFAALARPATAEHLGVRMCGASSLKHHPHGRWLPSAQLPAAWTSHAAVRDRLATSDACPWIKLRYLCPQRPNMFAYSWVPDVQLGGRCLVPDVDLPSLPRLVEALRRRAANASVASPDSVGVEKTGSAAGKEVPSVYVNFTSAFRPLRPGRPFRVVFLGDSHLREVVESLACRFRAKVDGTRLQVARARPNQKVADDGRKNPFGSSLVVEEDYRGRCGGYAYSASGWENFFPVDHRPPWLSEFHAAMNASALRNEEVVVMCNDDHALFRLGGSAAPIELVFGFVSTDPVLVLEKAGFSDPDPLTRVDAIVLQRVIHSEDVVGKPDIAVPRWVRAGFQGAIVHVTHFADHTDARVSALRQRSLNDSGPLFTSSTGCAQSAPDVPTVPKESAERMAGLNLPCMARGVLVPREVRVPSRLGASFPRSPDGSWSADLRWISHRADEPRPVVFPMSVHGRVNQKKPLSFEPNATSLPVHSGLVNATLLAAARTDAYPVHRDGSFDSHVCLPGITEDVHKLLLASLVSNYDWWLTEDTLGFLTPEQQAALRGNGS